MKSNPDDKTMSKKSPPPRNSSGYPQTTEENMKTDDETLDLTPAEREKAAADKAAAEQTKKDEAAKDAANKRQAKVRKAILSDLRLVSAKTLREWVADRITPEQAREMALGSETSSAD